jgi:hypothetical protein
MTGKTNAQGHGSQKRLSECTKTGYPEQDSKNRIASKAWPEKDS